MSRFRIPLILSLLPILLWTIAPAPAGAQDGPVTEITVVYHPLAPYVVTPEGYTRINVDLNQGAGGDYMYLCWKKGVGAPITGLAVTLNGGQPPSDARYTRINVDLNRNAGGDYVWLWYTRDPGCTVIRNLHVQPNQSAPPEPFTRIPVDLNSDAGGAYIYLCYEKG